MKKNNLIKTLSPEQQYAIKRWFIISLFLSSITIVIVIAFEIPQVYALQSIKKENTALAIQTESFNSIIGQQHKLKKKEQEYKEKQAKITKYKDELISLITHLSTVVQASKPACNIESLHIKPNSIELVAYCTQIQNATNFLDKLVESKQFHDTELTSLQYQTKQNPSFLFTIKGQR